MKHTWILVMLAAMLSACNNAPTQQNKAQDKAHADAHAFKIMYYNVENLFDTIDDPRFHDDEFTPHAEKQWNTQRYRAKQRQLASVIEAIGQGELPWIIGLEEVENDRVLRDLVAEPALAPAAYAIIHKDSPDFRGIDNAILYRGDKLKLLYDEIIPVTMPAKIASVDGKPMSTRDIVYARFLVAEKDTLHVFVNHWTSMYYGKEETMPHRAYCGRVLRQHVMPILQKNPHASIVMGGDFNEYVDAPGILDNLKADTNYAVLDNDKVYNLAHYAATRRQMEGTYNYRGQWGFLDHILVSGAMLNGQAAICTALDGMQVFKHDMVLNHYNNKYGKGTRPNRTYVHHDYKGGYSDHLPVVLNVVCK